MGRYGWSLKIGSIFRLGVKIKYPKPKISVTFSQNILCGMLVPGVQNFYSHLALPL